MVNRNSRPPVIPPEDDENGEEEGEDEDLPVPSWDDIEPYLEGEALIIPV